MLLGASRHGDVVAAGESDRSVGDAENTEQAAQMLQKLSAQRSIRCSNVCGPRFLSQHRPQEGFVVSMWQLECFFFSINLNHWKMRRLS